MQEELVPGHHNLLGFRLPDGTLSTAAERPEGTVGYRARCSCGWVGDTDYPAGDEGTWMATSEWGSAHMKPLWAATPPGWLLTRSDTLRDNIAELAPTWPLQALGLLAEVERWQKPLIERAVAAARGAGLSWAEIGGALGISRQSAHERFRNVVPKKAPD